MNIDKDKIEGFRALDPKEQKSALAEYAQTFGVKLNKQKSFDNMLVDFEAAVPAEDPAGLDKGTLVDVGSASVEAPVIVSGVTEGDLESLGFTPTNNASIVPDEVIAQPLTPHQKTVPILEAPVSASDESKYDLVWLDSFNPTITLMGRSARSNGYYTCPWWIYDWIKQNPEWYKDPEQCPHYSARDTLKSLVYYMKRDGQVTVRETRNSSFDTFKF